MENMIRSLFICCCLSEYWSIKLEYHSMMALAEKSFDGCNSIVYFVITIKGTGEEPKHLRWMTFSFSNLMAFSLLSVLVCQSSKSGGIYHQHRYSSAQYMFWRKWMCSKVPINSIQAEYWQDRDSIFIDCTTQRWLHRREEFKRCSTKGSVFLVSVQQNWGWLTAQRLKHWIKCQELFGIHWNARWPPPPRPIRSQFLQSFIEVFPLLWDLSTNFRLLVFTFKVYPNFPV